MRYVVRTVDFRPERLANVEVLRAALPDLEVIVDTQRDGYASYFRACSMLDSTGGVLLEDDAILCQGFSHELESIVAEKGLDDVYNFFEKPKTYFATGYVGGSNFASTLCTYLPPGFGSVIIAHYDEFRRTQPKRHTGMATDSLVSYVLKSQKQKYWRIRPCLVQHHLFRSSIGPRALDRQTPYFIDDLIARRVRYEDLQPAE
jgi:hypothetical protein